MECFRKALLMTGKGGSVLVGILAFPGPALSSSQALPTPGAPAGESQHLERTVTPHVVQAMSEVRTAFPATVPDDVHQPDSEHERLAKAESDAREKPPQRGAADGIRRRGQ